MAVELFTNEGSTTVSSGGTTAPASGTTETWTVASSASFPAISGSQQFHVTDPASSATAAELIAVTAVSGTSWTVTRGAESTAPVAHASGFTVQNVITSASLATFAQAGNGDLGGTGIAPTVTGTHIAALAPSGLTGATAATRYAGATASGAPGSGTFATGDFVIDQTGAVWVCTAAGTPGTWAQAGASVSPLLPAVGISVATLPGIWATGGGGNVGAQVLVMTLATAAASVTITKLGCWIASGGITAGAGVNGLAIYSSAGSRLGLTGDMTSAFGGSNTWAEAALTANVAITAGTNYYLAFLHNFTGTNPQMPQFSPAPGGVPGIHGNTLHGVMTSQASFPSSVTIGSLSNSAHWFYVAGSV